MKNYYLLVLTFCICRDVKSLGLMSNPYFEDINVIFVNGTYIDEDTLDVSVNYKPDALNSLHVKFDVIKDLPKDLNLKMEVSTRVFGRDVPSGLSLNTKLCDENGKAKKYYDLMLKMVGVDECPPKKGSYGKDDYTPDLSKIPIPLMSGTHLLIDSLVYAKDISILNVKCFIVT